MWAGVGIARDTLSPPDRCSRLIRKPVRPSPKLVESYDGIMGTHDLIVHNYGPGRASFSSRRVPQDADIRASHEIIDKAEREVSQKLNILLVIHMDPIETT